MAPDSSTSAREAILSRIRTALLPHPQSPANPEDLWSTIPRDYRHSSDTSHEATLTLLTNRLHDYDAQVLPVSRTNITQSIADLLTARGMNNLLVPLGFPESYLPKGFTYTHDTMLAHPLLDACAGVITTCTLAIAETGTIVLQNAPGQGRRAATLVPDYHLCLIEASQVVATVPQAIAALQPMANLSTTFISGPSATADIEMTRIKGVHGPRFLDVILIA